MRDTELNSVRATLTRAESAAADARAESSQWHLRATAAESRLSQLRSDSEGLRRALEAQRQSAATAERAAQFEAMLARDKAAHAPEDAMACRRELERQRGEHERLRVDLGAALQSRTDLVDELSAKVASATTTVREARTSSIGTPRVGASVDVNVINVTN